MLNRISERLKKINGKEYIPIIIGMIYYIFHYNFKKLNCTSQNMLKKMFK